MNQSLHTQLTITGNVTKLRFLMTYCEPITGALQQESN